MRLTQRARRPRLPLPVVLTRTPEIDRGTQTRTVHVSLGELPGG